MKRRRPMSGGAAIRAGLASMAVAGLMIAPMCSRQSSQSPASYVVEREAAKFQQRMKERCDPGRDTCGAGYAQ